MSIGVVIDDVTGARRCGHKWSQVSIGVVIDVQR